MNESKWKKELEDLDAMIESKGLKVDKSHYYTNGYDAPFKLFNRRNEVNFRIILNLFLSFSIFVLGLESQIARRIKIPIIQYR